MSRPIGARQIALYEAVKCGDIVEVRDVLDTHPELVHGSEEARTRVIIDNQHEILCNYYISCYYSSCYYCLIYVVVW